MKRYSLLLTLLVFILGACSSETEEVNVYSSRHYDTDLELYEKFTEETGIEVNLIEGSSDELIERILNEGVNSPADVVITVDAGRLWRAKEAGILQPHNSDFLEETIPDELQEVDDHWIGLSQRVRAIIYNKDAVDETDLAGYLENMPEDAGRSGVLLFARENLPYQVLFNVLDEIKLAGHTRISLQARLKEVQAKE